MLRRIILLLFSLSFINAQIALPTFQAVHKPHTTSGDCNGTPETPLGSNLGSPFGTGYSWSYIMGYKFTPQVDGCITKLGGYFDGSKTARLWKVSSEELLAKVTVTSYYDSPGNSWELIIGVGHTRNNLTTYCTSGGRSYGYIAQNGGKANSGSQTSYGSTYGEGDVIKVELDMSTGNLTFYKNNISQGVAYSVNTSKTYYLVTSIGNNGTMVEITN